MRAAFASTLFVLSVTGLTPLTALAGGYLNGHTVTFWDRETVHFTNTDRQSVSGTFYFSYDYKCGDAYTTWQHVELRVQNFAVGGYRDGYAVYYFQPCSVASQVKNERFMFLSANWSESGAGQVYRYPNDIPPHDQPQPGQQPPQPEPQQPDQHPVSQSLPQEPQAPGPLPQPQPEPQPQPQPTGPCWGPLGAWANAHTIDGETYSASLQNGVLTITKVRPDGIIGYYTIALSAIDPDSIATIPADQMTFNSFEGQMSVKYSSNRGDSHWNWGAMIPYLNHDEATAARYGLEAAVAQCTGRTAFAPLLKKHAATSPEAVALETDGSASKEVHASSGTATSEGSRRTGAPAMRVD